MPIEEDFSGEAGFPKLLYSKLIHYTGETVTGINFTYNGAGVFRFYVGTSDRIDGTITWEEITIFGVNIALTYPNMAIYINIISTNGSYIYANGTTPAYEMKIIK